MRLGAAVIAAMALDTAGAPPGLSVEAQPLSAWASTGRPPSVDDEALGAAQPALIEKARAGLLPPAPGRTNVYAMAVAASGAQALFAREAHEALRVAALHFGGDGRGGVLLSNGAADLMTAPLATRNNIAALARAVAEQADPGRDVLFLYLVSHGARTAALASGLTRERPVAPISAVSTARALKDAGVGRRVIVISACFAASWIPALANDDTIVIAAAAPDRTSFGCDDTRRLTFFGEAFLGSLAQPNISLRDAFDEARRRISAEERQERVIPSQPQAFVGRNMQALWLAGSPPRR